MQELQAAEIDRILGEILARAEFRPPSPAPLWRALGAAWDWVWVRLGDLLGWMAPGLDAASPAWSFAARAALVLLTLVGAGVLVHLVRLVVGSVRARRGSGRAARPVEGSRDPVTAEEWEARARSAAAEERWRDAVMALYQAVIHRLAQEERIRLDPGKTPGDYRRELGDDPGTASLLDSFVRHWERVAFGGRLPGRRAWHELLEMARVLGAGRG